MNNPSEETLSDSSQIKEGCNASALSPKKSN